jgi:hypothetical protein
MKMTVLRAGLIVTGLIVATKVIGVAVLLLIGRSLEGDFLMRQAIYATSFLGLSIWFWEAMGREKTRQSAHVASSDEGQE